MECFVLFEDDGTGAPLALLGVFSSIESALGEGKRNINTEIIVHTNGQYMTTEEAYACLSELDDHLMCIGDNGEYFHVYRVLLDKPRVLEDH